MSADILQIIDFQPELAKHFKSINMLWIEQFFTPEKEDLKILNDPKTYIIDPGGVIIFARYKDQIVGTCGLKKCSDNEYELIKMGVLEAHQGLRIGETLGRAIIKIAIEYNCKRLFLETNSALKPAISLYQKLGFKNTAINECQRDYERCDVIMELLIDS